MAETYTLTAESRAETGKSVRRLRADGKVPAVLYGHKIKPVALTLSRGELEKVYRKAGGSSVVTVKLDQNEHPVLIHEIQDDPVTGKHLHADLFVVRMDEKIKATVPIVFEGTETAPAVRELDGVLLTNLTELEVECLPGDLPSEVVVNVEPLETFEDVITVADLKLPEVVTVLHEPETNVAAVKPPRTQEELDELEEEAELDMEAVEGAGEEGAEGEAAEGEGAEGEDKGEAAGDEDKSGEQPDKKD